MIIGIVQLFYEVGGVGSIYAHSVFDANTDREESFAIRQGLGCQGLREGLSLERGCKQFQLG